MNTSKVYMENLRSVFGTQPRPLAYGSARQITRIASFTHHAPPPHRAAPHRGLTARAAFAKAESAEDLTYSEGQGDYYSILGVGPTATSADIKRAYRRLMKDWHPDQSNDDDTHEFAIFLNQVYETLMDPDSRAEYDVISGFSFAGINPFADRSYPAEFAFVDEFSCIGCRNCNNVCPKTFAMEEEYGRARVMRQGVDTPDKIQEAIDTCPVSCIHWVSAPQLTMLEETMARMERVDAWILMQGGGKGANLNVFGEASIRWEKRQAAQRAREDRARWAWAPFTSPAAGANMQDAARKARERGTTDSSDFDDGASTGSTRPGRRVNAAEMASAARKWRDYQRIQRQKKQKLLS